MKTALKYMTALELVNIETGNCVSTADDDCNDYDDGYLLQEENPGSISPSFGFICPQLR